MLSPNAIAVEGVGFSPLLLAVRGLLPDDAESAVSFSHTCVSIFARVRTTIAIAASVCVWVTVSGEHGATIDTGTLPSVSIDASAFSRTTVEVTGEVLARVTECEVYADVSCTARVGCDVSVTAKLGASVVVTEKLVASVAVVSAVAARVDVSAELVASSLVTIGEC